MTETTKFGKELQLLLLQRFEGGKELKLQPGWHDDLKQQGWLFLNLPPGTSNIHHFTCFPVPYLLYILKNKHLQALTLITTGS